MTGLRIGWAMPRDIPGLAPLMRALYAHETPAAPAPDDATLHAHLDRLMSPETPHRLAVAWDADGRALGLAAVAFFTSVSDPRPTHRTQAELKELFVLPGARSSGLGAAILHWVETQADARQACRVDWHVKRDNTRGIAFYERFGGAVVDTRLSMRKTLLPGDI